jgi:hypothetical protein
MIHMGTVLSIQSHCISLHKIAYNLTSAVSHVSRFPSFSGALALVAFRVMCVLRNDCCSKYDWHTSRHASSTTKVYIMELFGCFYVGYEEMLAIMLKLLHKLPPTPAFCVRSAQTNICILG